MSNDKTHAEMVAEVAANYTREACVATQGVIEAVRGHKDECVDCGRPSRECECPDELYEAAFNQNAEDEALQALARTAPTDPVRLSRPGRYRAALWAWNTPLTCAFAQDADGQWWVKPPHAVAAVPVAALPGLVVGKRVGDLLPGAGIVAQANYIREKAICEILRREKAAESASCDRGGDEAGDCGARGATTGTHAHIEALMAENYKLVAKISELQVAIEFLRSQKP